MSWRPKRPRKVALSLTVVADSPHVALVRREIQAMLIGHQRLDDLLLVVSELVTNALLHGSESPGALVGVRIVRLPFGNLYVRVIDQGRRGSVRPPVSRPGADEDAGLGSLIVDRLVRRCWSRRTRTGGRCVHALLGPRGAR